MKPPPKPKSVVDQVAMAVRPRNRLPTLMGAFLGGFVPLATYVIAHLELGAARWCLVVGGLIYSAKTVFEWGQVAFSSRVKAAGFVLLLEGVMITSTTRWLGWSALAYLISINGLATGCNLALDRRVR